MSWSVAAQGRPAAVLIELTRRLDATNCSEPEQSIKEEAKKLIIASLSSFPAKSAVIIAACGSQSPNPAGGYVNSLEIKVTPLWQFLEDE